MNSVDVKARIETLKSIARGVWFGLLGLVAAGLAAVVSSGAVADVYVHVAGLTLNLTVVIVAAVGFLLKVIDTYLHKNDNVSVNGIAPSFLQK